MRGFGGLCRVKAERAMIGNCRAGEVCGRVVWGGMTKRE